MPSFMYTCAKTGETVEHFVRAGRRKPKCLRRNGNVFTFDFVATARTVQTPPAGMYPRFSTALGCFPSEVEDNRKTFPHHEYNDDGDVLVTSRKHLESIAREVIPDGDRNRLKTPKRKVWKPGMKMGQPLPPGVQVPKQRRKKSTLDICLDR